MARPRTAAKKPTAGKPKWTKEQLVYLAGIWSSSQGLKAPGDRPVVIAPVQYPEWTEFLAETYGGESKSFPSNAGRMFNGWYVDNELKLEFLNELERAGVLFGISTNWRDLSRDKITKIIEKMKRSS